MNMKDWKPLPSYWIATWTSEDKTQQGSQLFKCKEQIPDREAIEEVEKLIPENCYIWDLKRTFDKIPNKK